MTGREGFADLRNAFSRGPPVLVHYTAADIRFFLKVFKEGIGF
jgi:hypothetical protein